MIIHNDYAGYDDGSDVHDASDSGDMMTTMMI